jgi:hypothetical protein
MNTETTGCPDARGPDGIIAETMSREDSAETGVVLRYVGGYQPYVTHAFATYPGDRKRGYVYGNYFRTRANAEADFAKRSADFLGAGGRR